MSRVQPQRAYCGAPPPEGRTTASCVLGAGGHREHRNLDGLRWSDRPPTPQCGDTMCTAPATRQTYSDDYDEQDPWNADGFALWCAAHAPADSWPLVLSEPEATR